ncbi:Desumoylating isopeptidase 1 (DeSI-1) (PPPDE peptidase domain-containing protein 2) [Durusdinium trenchii]|uniref:Desumoylating isopeptidase 1 (DeSI-1) (PPPDE peptidase domain-containing protein 2) n=1 Tax=Durusdinium trenchii TaxID=1381693 RepID=A0ABP0RJE3_9DINO
MLAEKVQFFVGEEKYWNWFDLALVTESIIGVFLEGGPSLSFLRIFRVFRLVRVVKVVRSVKALARLRTMIFAILHSFVDLLWAFLVIVLIVFVFAIVFDNAVADYFLKINPIDILDPESKKAQEVFNMELLFGDLLETMISLWSAVSGGNDWMFYGDLLREVPMGGMYFAIFNFYVAFCVVGMFNVVTGVFVDSAVCVRTGDEVVQGYLDDLRQTTEEIKGFFKEADIDGSGTLNWSEFQHHMQNPAVKAYFSGLDIDPEEAEIIFTILDGDKSKEIKIDEFVNGTMKLKGSATKLDLMALMYDQTRQNMKFDALCDFVEEELQDIKRRMQAAPSPRNASREPPGAPAAPRLPQQVPAYRSPQRPRQVREVRIDANVPRVIDSSIPRVMVPWPISPEVWAYERWVFQGNEFPHARAGIDVRLAPVYGQKVLQPEGMLKGESKLSRLLDAWEPSRAGDERRRGSMRSVSVARRYEFRVLKWEGISNLREVHAKPTPMIEKENQGVSSDLLQKCSLIARLRREYRAKGSLNVAGLCTLWLHQTLQEGKASNRHGVSGRELQALALRAAQQLQDLHLKSWTNDEEISEEEYVHAMLLLKAPDRAAAQIYLPLKASLAKYPNMLLNLQNLFDRADTRGCAYLTQSDVARMYRHRSWRLHPSCMDGRPLTDEELEDPDDLARQLVEAMDIDQDGVVSYAEFVAFCVGRRKKEVKLHLYDLSRGSGNQFQWLLGEGMEQIWHTGVVAFDKEYLFSSDTIFDTPGKTSFGEPSQVRSLGYTFWNQEELHDFIVCELKPIFHRDTYDVICNNCNHFSDRVSMYLTGNHLPQDILLQSDRLMDLVTVRAVRPFLNWLLRDCVVSREGTARPVEVPHGKWHRITTCEEVVPGAVVALHPDWGRTAGVLGIVCDAREAETIIGVWHCDHLDEASILQRRSAPFLSTWSWMTTAMTTVGPTSGLSGTSEVGLKGPGRPPNGASTETMS